MDINLLKKFYKGQCSPEETAKVMQWFEEGDNKEATMRQLASYWEAYEESPTNDHDASSILKNIQARIQAEEQDESLFDNKSKTISSRFSTSCGLPESWTPKFCKFSSTYKQ